jgi:hypothetical protein
MDALDGNAIAGQLYELFDKEMTTVRGTCKSCGTPEMVGQLLVYLRAPGTVARCPTCMGVALVITTIRDQTRIDMSMFDGMGPLAAGASGQAPAP